MNKKRVALALAAALGINTLMVTVGQSFGQVQVAHAQSARLTEESDIKKLAGIKIKTLETTVETASSSDVTLTFKGLNKDNVTNVTGTLTYTKFAERTGDSNSNVNVVWDSSLGKATVKGMNAPGLYTGNVTITYKDGTKEEYTITLRKTYAQEYLTADVKVGIANIEVSGVKLGSVSVVPSATDVLELQLSDGTVIDTIKDGADKKFTVPNMTVGNVYNLVYKKSGVEQGRTQIVLTEQKQPTIKSYYSNDTTAAGGDITAGGTFKADVAGEYDVADAAVTITPSGTPVATDFYDQGFAVKVDNKDIVSYTQTLYDQTTKILGGGKIKATDNANGGVDLELTGVALGSVANFVPSIKLGHGTTVGASTTFTTLVGDYTVTINNGNAKSYYNASEQITGVEAAVNGGNTAYLKVTGGVQDLNTVTSVNIGNIDNLSHGYQSISVVFDAQSNDIKGQNYKSWESDVKALVKGTVTASALPKEEKITKKTTTSVIVAKDAIDGAVVNAKFEKTGESKGNITLEGSNDVFKNVDNNTLANNLKVIGSTSVIYLNRDAKGNPVFEVQFNGQVPSTINWSLNKLSSQIDVVTVDAVNFDGEVKVANTSNTDKLKQEFEIEAKFNSVVPTGGTLRLEKKDGTAIQNVNSLIVKFDQLENGSQRISTTTTSGKYRGKYSAGIIVSVQPMGLKITKTESNTAGRVDLTIDGTFFNTDDYKNVTKGTIQYREKGTTNWTNANVTFTVGENSDISTDAQKDKTLTKSVTGLTAGKEYEFQVIYDYKEGNNTIAVTSNIATQKVSNANNNNNGTITGNGSSSSTTGTSTGSTTISVNTNNSTLSGTSASVKLPSGFRYDSGKTPVAVTFKYKDKDGKVVTETKEQFSNVTAKFNGDNVEVNGLVPGKNYDEITVDYTDNNGRTRSIILRNIQTSTTVESDKYLANVYTVVFNRPADEAGYHFHLDNLKNKRVSLREFLLNMLSEKEFIEKYKSTEQKVEALYSAIVARDSDEAGKKFWVEEYNKALKVYGSESTALRAIADRMVNENELKELADKMGVQW